MNRRELFLTAAGSLLALSGASRAGSPSPVLRGPSECPRIWGYELELYDGAPEGWTAIATLHPFCAGSLDQLLRRLWLTGHEPALLCLSGSQVERLAAGGSGVKIGLVATRPQALYLPRVEGYQHPVSGRLLPLVLACHGHPDKLHVSGGWARWKG